MRARLWLFSLVCAAGGVVSHIVFRLYAPPTSSADAWAQWEIQTLWYGAALLLWLAHLWRLGTTGWPASEIPSCGMALLMTLGAVAAFLMAVWCALPFD